MNLDAPPSLTRLDDLGVVDPFIETQFDAHWIDVKDQWTAIPLADGTYTVVPITGIWFLAKLDVGSRTCVAWHLVIGPAYDQFDFIQTLANALTVWSPRTLSGTHLSYLPNAWMPSSDGLPLIPLILSLDNFSGNIAKHARRVLLQNHHGVYHFGVAGIARSACEWATTHSSTNFRGSRSARGTKCNSSLSAGSAVAIAQLIDAVVDNSLAAGDLGQLSAREAGILLSACRALLCSGYAQGLRCTLSRYVPELYGMGRDKPHLTEPWVLVVFSRQELVKVLIRQRPMMLRLFGEADALEHADAANRRRPPVQSKKATAASTRAKRSG